MKHYHKEDQTTANRPTIISFFFTKVGTAVWPRNFYHGNSEVFSRGKNPWLYSGFFFRKQNTENRHSIFRGVVFLMVFSPMFFPHWKFC